MAIALATAIQELIQQDLLRREYETALRPAQLFRALSTRRERWDARLGQEEIFTRTGLLPINARARTAGVDPTPQSKPSIEQWRVIARPYNDTLDTHLPSSYVMIQNDFLRDAKALAVQAGQTVNHVLRNKVYAAYSGGNAYVTADVATSSTTIHVNALQGLDTVLKNGRPVSVSGSLPLSVTVAGTANTIVGVMPDDDAYPEGPGNVTLGTAITATAGDAVLAANRSRVQRIGGAATVRGLTPSDKLTLAAIRAGVAQLRGNFVPTFADGTYHMHLNSQSELELFADTEFQNLVRGQVNDPIIREALIARAMGVTFIRNEETPGSANTSANDYVPFDVVVPSGTYQNMPIHRPILLGDTAIMEKFLPQDAYLTNAGVQGKLGSFDVLNDGGVATLTDGIRYIVRSPQNRLQDTVAQTWAFEGDWAIPTDSLSGTADLYKRAVVFEHA